MKTKSPIAEPSVTKSHDPLNAEQLPSRTIYGSGLRDAELKAAELRSVREEEARQVQAEAARAARQTEFERSVTTALINIGSVVGNMVEKFYWFDNGQQGRAKVLEAHETLKTAINRLRVLPAQEKDASAS